MKRFLLIGLLLAVAVAGGAGAWLAGAWLDFSDRPLVLPAEGLRVELPPGGNVQGLARDLARAGAIRHPLYLVLLARYEGVDRQLKAGEYAIVPGTTPRQLLARIAAGDVIEYSLTLVEGWNFRQVLEAVGRAEFLRHTLDDTDPEAVMARLGHAGEHPEGRFFPDTYRYHKGMSDVAFLERAYRTMARHLEREWVGRDEGLPYESPYEALIMASIVEKETGVPEERPAIAGVFVRRLQRGMLLQTDPTVIYGLGETFDGNLRRSHLQEDGPYNTYTRPGLPPSPIAMPGLEAIRAALHPAPGKDLYFVARGDGSHAFSASLAEHNRAVARYQLHRGRRAQENGEPNQ